MEELKGKNAIITGASSGIGKATAHRLAEEGVSIALASRSKDKLKELAEDLREKHCIETAVIPTDVTEKEQLEQLLDKAVEVFDEIHIVVANAGLAYSGEVETMPDEHYEKNNEVNIDGVFYTARESIPYLKETEGNLVLLGSIAGQYPRGTNPVYAASKWWVRGFGLSLSAQVGNQGVAVTVVNPSEVRTDFNSEAGTAFQDAFEPGQVSEPEDVAESIVFAAKQNKTNTLEEIDLFRRDKLSDMELG